MFKKINAAGLRNSLCLLHCSIGMLTLAQFNAVRDSWPLMTAGLPDGCATLFMSDEDLAANAHNPQLEDELLSLFEQLRGPLLRYLLLLGLAPARAEELVQETFLRLFIHLRGARSKNHLSSPTNA
jgi:hypothetical protein